MSQEVPAPHPPKLFVLDTNVILHDAGCIGNFQENDVAVPIAVLEELDRFKKGNDDINIQAREFLRRLDQLTGDVLSDSGASLGEKRGAIRVVLGGTLQEQLKEAFFQDTADHRILATALSLQQREPQRRVILVSKDTNLRMKAKSLGLTAQDYTSDKVESFEKLYTGRRIVEHATAELIDVFYAAGDGVPADCVPVDQPLANENFILRNGSKSVLATYRASDRTFHRLERPELPDQPDDRPVDLRPRDAGERRAFAAGRSGQRPAVVPGNRSRAGDASA